MALTTQVDGEQVGGQPNTIFASWFNDYKDLLTGTMPDQPVTFKNTVVIQGLSANPAAPSAAVVAGAALGIGVYEYAVTLVDVNGGETALGATVQVTTTSGNQAVNLSGIPTGPTGTAKRKVYRTAVGGSNFLLLTTLNDNTTTTYSDTTADGSLGGAVHNLNTMGSLQVKDAGGTVQAQIGNDGTITSEGYTVPRLKAFGSLTQTGRTIWIMLQGDADPTAGDGLVEGDIVLTVSSS